MSTYQFKTNINCIGCVTQIKPHLDQLEQNKSIEHWHVDMNDPNHTLTIETERMNQEEVQKVVKDAGFNAEPAGNRTRS